MIDSFSNESRNSPKFLLGYISVEVYIDLDFVYSKLGICSEISAVSFISIRFISDKRIKGPKTPLVIEPNDYLRQVIVGLMLGDLTAERSFLNGNTRLRFYQSNINKLYIYHLYSLFNLYLKTGRALLII